MYEIEGISIAENDQKSFEKPTCKNIHRKNQ